MYLVAVQHGSVMHMPTVKIMCVMFLISFASAVGVDFFYEKVLVYSNRAAFFTLLISVFLLMSTIASFYNPIVSSNGEIAYRYPELASILFGIFLGEFIFRKKSPVYTPHIIMLDILKPETIFLYVSLFLGIILVFSLPAKTLTCWDDDEFYRTTLQLSEGIYYAFDDSDIFFFYGWDNTKAGLQETMNNGSMFLESDIKSLLPPRVGFLGSTCGLWLGRIFKLTSDAVFTVGRLGGLIAYVIIMYFAISRLKSFKLVLFLIALSPNAIMTAVGYSYDAWVLSFTSLAFAYFFGALQRPYEKLSSREICIMLGAMSIGTWPKMPFIALILLFLLMPKDKFTDNNQRRKFILSIISIIILEMIYTLITTLTSGKVGDYRGGNDVNAYEQLTGILSNPVGYLGVLLNFLSGYLLPSSEISMFGYLSDGNEYIIILIFIAIFAFIDNDGVIKLGAKTRIIGLAVLFLQICMIATIFYMVFTPVGDSTINGCQIRYKIPMYFPFAFLLLSNYVDFSKINKKILNIAAYVVSSGCLIHCMVTAL